VERFDRGVFGSSKLFEAWASQRVKVTEIAGEVAGRRTGRAMAPL